MRNKEDFISDEDEKQILEHSRNVLISADRNEQHDRQPFILSVQYLGGPNVHRAVELDNEIMPIIKKVVEKYRKSRKVKK